MSTNLGEMLGEEELEAVIDVRGSLIDAWAELQIFNTVVLMCPRGWPQCCKEKGFVDEEGR